MMKKYYVVDDKGMIVRTGVCQSHLLHERANGMSIYEGDVGNPDHFYAPNGVPKRRPLLKLKVTQKGGGMPFRIDNIPKGTLVEYPNGSILVDDGYIEWDSFEEGVYKFKLSNFPYVEEIVYAEIRDL